MRDYLGALAAGQARYQDVLDRLAAAGMPAVFTQTGGMCAALQVTLDSGHLLLVTDAEDTLAWDRAEHEGWRVGLFPPDQADTDGECLAHASTPDGAPDALLPLVRSVLGRYSRRRAG